MVVVEMTSYGRSFGMAEADCFTEDCFFTGSSAVSNAEPGPCTTTAGYISNAEINDIAAKSSRVTTCYIDEKSNSKILVYDDLQWVAFMDDSIRASRVTFYQALELGGAFLWAANLLKFNNAPYPSTSWPKSIILAGIGNDSYAEGNRTGNWTTLICPDPAVQNVSMTTDQRRNQLDCPMLKRTL